MTNASPAWRSIGERFAESARRHAHLPALVEALTGRVVTYAELDDLSRRVAAAVRARGGDRNRIIAILMKNGAEALGTALGVMRAGRYFVGLSAADLAPRMAELARTVRAEDLITHEPCAELARQVRGPEGVIHLRDLENAVHTSDPDLPVAPTDPCMVVLTSGSTGEPKAVVHAHHNQGCEIEFNRAIFNLGPGDHLTLFGSLAGGASLGMALSSLCSGACIHPFDLKTHDADALIRWLHQQRITMLQTTPNAFRLLMRHLPARVRFPDLRVLRVGGDQLRGSDIADFRSRFEPHTEFFNTFGITEVGTLCYQRIGHTETVPDWIPAGLPCPQRRLVVEDEHGRRLGPGERGYLVVEGPFISSGYLHQPDLTRERFEFHPDNPDRNRYFTGDIAHLDPDGRCTLWGRNDAQAKINGETVRPGEIERALLGTDEFRAAAITLQNDLDGHPRVIAYVVNQRDTPLDPERIRERITGQLTPSMMPAAFVALPELPHTPGGKIDRKALPPLDFSAWTQRPEKQPQTPVERALATVWQEVLRIRHVARDDRFTVLGGQSIVSAELISRLSALLHEPVLLTMLHDAPSLEAQARYLEEHHAQGVQRWLGIKPQPAPHLQATELSPLLAELRHGGARPPFFCVAGAGSDPSAMAELARAMPDDQPFYSFHPAWVDGTLRAPHTMEELAAHYVSALRTRQPAGPYLLGGSSFGGLIAWEMARQLEVRGERITALALLDTRPPGYPPRRPCTSWRHLLFRMTRWMTPIGEDVAFTPAQLKAGVEQRWRRLCARLARRFGIPAPRLDPLIRYAHLLEGHFQAARRYRLQPTTAPVTLFRCTAQPPDAFYLNSPTMTWDRYARGPFAVIPIPGKHGQQIRFPYVEETARQLRDVIARANGG